MMMDPRDVPPRCEVEAADDPNDLIVGTIRPPAWLGRIPTLVRRAIGRISTLAWPFIGLAGVDAAVRLYDRLGPALDGISAIGLLSLLMAVVEGAATVLLSAALLVGGRRSGGAASWLVQGALGLVGAEMVRLFGEGVLDVIVGPRTLDENLTEPFLRSSAIWGLAILLELFGLARIAFGLGDLARARRRLGLCLFAGLVSVVALATVAAGLSMEGFLIQPGERTPLLLNVAIVTGGLLRLGLWVSIAAIASRREGRSWSTILVGSLAVVLASAVGSVGWLIFLWLWPGWTQDPLSWLNGLGLISSTAAAVGAVALCVGFALVLHGAGADDGTSQAAPDGLRRDPV
jgi:hypothetical protein